MGLARSPRLAPMIYNHATKGLPSQGSPREPVQPGAQTPIVGSFCQAEAACPVTGTCPVSADSVVTGTCPVSADSVWSKDQLLCASKILTLLAKCTTYEYGFGTALIVNEYIVAARHSAYTTCDCVSVKSRTYCPVCVNIETL